MVGKASRPVILTPAYWKHDYYLTAAHLPIPFTLTLGRAKAGCTQSWERKLLTWDPFTLVYGYLDVQMAGRLY
jgi:hypothetical protein